MRWDDFCKVAPLIKCLSHKVVAQVFGQGCKNVRVWGALAEETAACSTLYPCLIVMKGNWEVEGRGCISKKKSVTTDCDIFPCPLQTCKTGRVGITSPFYKWGNWDPRTSHGWMTQGLIQIFIHSSSIYWVPLDARDHSRYKSDITTAHSELSSSWGRETAKQPKQ